MARASAQGNMQGWRRRCLQDWMARWSGGDGLGWEPLYTEGEEFGVRSPVDWLCDRRQVRTSRNVGLVIRTER